MAAGTTQLADVIVPEIFGPYVQQLTQEKSAIIQSGAAVVDPILNANLAGAGATFNNPSFKDLDNDAENVSTDNPATLSTPNKIGTASEIQVRLSRNNSWASMDLVSDLIAEDPSMAIANRVSAYWTRRHQAAFIATMKGVFADNDAAPTGTEHVQYDLTHDVSGSSFVNGVTNFTAEAFVDATATLGDSMDMLGLVCVHSVVYARMKKNDMIDFIPDSLSGSPIAYFQGRRVIVDDAMPVTSGVFDSWLFGAGAVRLGMGSAKTPVETIRVPAAGNGSGQEVMHSRVEWIIHPAGNKYAGTAPTGGPTNAATSNNLANAGSWQRVFSERKQIQIARLKTREY